jgi:hypothetical protein
MCPSFISMSLPSISLEIFLFLPSIYISLPSIFLFLPSISLPSIYLSPLSFYFSHLSISPLYLSISPIYLSLPSIFLFLTSISLSIPSISLSPPLFPEKKFPALDPSLATTHLYSRWPLAPDSRKWRITRANVSNASHIFPEMTFGECRRVWRVWRVRHGILANLANF